MTEEITIAGASGKFTATSSNGESISAKSLKQLLEKSLNGAVIAALMPNTELHLDLEGSDRYEFLGGIRPWDSDALLKIATEDYPELWNFYHGDLISNGNTIDGAPWCWMPTTIDYDPAATGSYDDFGIAPMAISEESGESSVSLWMAASMTGGTYRSSMRFSYGVTLSMLTADEKGIVDFELTYGVDPGISFSGLVEWVLDDYFVGPWECCPHDECNQNGWEITVEAQKYIPSAAIADAVNRIWTPCEQHRDSSIELAIEDLGDWLWSPKTKKWSKEE